MLSTPTTTRTCPIHDDLILKFSGSFDGHHLFECEVPRCKVVLEMPIKPEPPEPHDPTDSIPNDAR